MCNAARGFMISLGCIQALKCHTNTCPTGITTLNPDLVAGLHVPTKAERVKSFQSATVKMCCELAGAAGVHHPREFRRHHISVRLGANKVKKT